MLVEQFVMAYAVEQDRLRALLPEGFVSLRPVLRVNGEITVGESSYLELNTPVEKDGIRGWLNIGFWQNVPFEKQGKTTVFRTENLEISFAGVGIQGGCPAEKDNGGCFFLPEGKLRLPETIAAPKEFCDCEFKWDFGGRGASGKSIGKTLPALQEEVKIMYPKEAFTVQNAAVIPCRQVLGTYTVKFQR